MRYTVPMLFRSKGHAFSWNAGRILHKWAKQKSEFGRIRVEFGRDGLIPVISWAKDPNRRSFGPSPDIDFRPEELAEHSGETCVSSFGRHLVDVGALAELGPVWAPIASEIARGSNFFKQFRSPHPTTCAADTCLAELFLGRFSRCCRQVGQRGFVSAA